MEQGEIPGPAGIGIVIADDKGNILKEVSKFLGDTTNNSQNMKRWLKGWERLRECLEQRNWRIFDIEVKLDSELVANQLSGTYQIKEESLFPQFIRIHNMQVKDFPKIKFSHIPREKNKEADRLANEAMDAA